uniref:Uncharacterized protein n=1 Tax=Arundo donax TaxID=35708 RepID=A0A0A8ZXH2_ARUDO
MDKTHEATNLDIPYYKKVGSKYALTQELNRVGPSCHITYAIRM